MDDNEMKEKLVVDMVNTLELAKKAGKSRYEVLTDLTNVGNERNMNPEDQLKLIRLVKIFMDELHY